MITNRDEIDAVAKTQHHFSSGVYAREMHVPAGYTVGTHKHVFDHMSILARGNVRVQTGTESAEYFAPAVLHIRAGIKHQIYAKTDAIWYCVHATDVADKDKIDDVLIERI